MTLLQRALLPASVADHKPGNIGIGSYPGTLVFNRPKQEHPFLAIMAAPVSAYKDRHFLAVIGDEVSLVSSAVSRPRWRTDIDNAFKDSVTGLLLAGIGVRATRAEGVCTNFLS